MIRKLAVKIWVLSDLHNDVNKKYPFEVPTPLPDYDVLVVAGDIQEGVVDSVRWLAAAGLTQKPVVYVTGNHEFYHYDLAEERAAAAVEIAAHHPNIHLLQDSTYAIGNVLFIGATLWTDYCLFTSDIYSKMDAQKGFNDHRYIFNGVTHVGRKLMFSPTHAQNEHLISRWFIEQQLNDRGPRKAVVVTHHVPTIKGVHPRWRSDRLTPAFASNLEHIVEKADVWVYGHTHDPTDFMIGGCRLINNAYGYIGQGEGMLFDPSFVIEV